MLITERQEKILELIRENSYITVNDLSAATFTSPSSIRRDLTHLQNNGLVLRTHGGVTLPESVSGLASLQNRKQENKNSKRLLAKKAASLLQDGQTILLDGSSTVMYLLPHIAKNSTLRIYTNNLSTALEAIELGINTNCMGGHSLNGSTVMTGPDTCRVLESINADICFFSSQSLDANGVISDPMAEENYIRQLMIKYAKHSVFLCDSSKFNKQSLYRLTTLDQIGTSIFDTCYPELQCSCNCIW